MAESTEYVAMPNLINGALSGAGTLQAIIPMHGRHSLSIVETYNQDATHTLVASLTLEVTNNYNTSDVGNPNVRWALVTDASIIAALTTDQTASPAGAKPNGSPSTSGFYFQIDPLRCAAVRWTVTWVSGNGSYTLDGEAQ